MKTQLKQWLLNKPVIFTLIFVGLTFVLGFIYSIVQTFLNIESAWPMYLIFGFAFIVSVYYMIKKLPNDTMPRNDFIAITNGNYIISIISSLIAIIGIGLLGANAQQKIMAMYLLHPTQFMVLFTIISLISLYLLGLSIAGIYAKYKRATTMGISPWKAILSMPFGFLLMWMPGYLIEEKGKKSNLLIKSNWYARFNNWIVSNFSNTIFVFLFLMFYKCVISGLSTTVLTCALIIIYTIWYVKHKKDFVKNINGGYALASVLINIAIIIAIILTTGQTYA